MNETSNEVEVEGWWHITKRPWLRATTWFFHKDIVVICHFYLLNLFRKERFIYQLILLTFVFPSLPFPEKEHHFLLLFIALHSASTIFHHMRTKPNKLAFMILEWHVPATQIW